MNWKRNVPILQLWMETNLLNLVLKPGPPLNGRI